VWTRSEKEDTLGDGTGTLWWDVPVAIGLIAMYGTMFL
jgi:hypothetical protein